MITIEHARKLRAMIEKASASLTDNDALQAIEMFPVWEVGVEYSVDSRIRYGEKLYKVLQAHTSQEGWEPDKATSLFAEVLIPDPSVIPEWEQPSSTNPYMMGDKVRHNEKVWVSDIDNNVWEPGVYGWTETEE